MRIAYNPKTAQALMSAPNNEDITFDLSGLAIYVKGVKFEGKAYSVFKKHTLNTTGGYDGLVPAPSYTETTERYLREDGTWVVPNNTTANLADYVTVNTTQTITGSKRFTSAVKIQVDSDISLNLVSKGKYSAIAFVCNKDSNTLTKLNGYFLYRGDTNYILTDSNWMHEYKILHSGNSSIKDGVITINNTSITPLTSHQSLTNYVTLNGDQTISGVKTFSSLLKFTVAKGTAPFLVTSDTLVTNLNADLLDGLDSKRFLRSVNRINNQDFNATDEIDKNGNCYYNTNYVLSADFLQTNAPYAYGMLTSLNSEASGMDFAVNGPLGAPVGLKFRKRWLDKYSEWKQIAFTDSDITGNAASADKVNNSLTLKINSGTTEGTDLYTYNGSAAKTLNIKNGVGIGFTSDAGSVLIYNAGVRSIATGTTNGTISVNTNGTTANVAVKGLDTAAYTKSSEYIRQVNLGKKLVDVKDIWTNLELYWGNARSVLAQFMDDSGHWGHLFFKSQNPRLSEYGVDAAGLFMRGRMFQRWTFSGKDTEEDPLVLNKYKIYDESNLTVVSSSDNGLTPKVINTNTATVGSSYYVLASTNGSAAPSWYKLPANAFANDDTKVTQTNTTSSADYRVLFSGNANDTTETTTARKSTNLLFNPSTGKLTAKGFIGEFLTKASAGIANTWRAGTTMAWFPHLSKTSDNYAGDNTGFPVNSNANGILWLGVHPESSNPTKNLGHGFLLGFSSNGNIYSRYFYSNIPTTANGGSWKQIAYTNSNITGNAATADKLKTKRKLWGLNFDGSADVSGDMTGVGSIIRSEKNAVNTDSLGNLKFKESDVFQTWSIQNHNSVAQFVVGENGNTTVTGFVKAPTFQGNLDGTYVNKLTGYTKATAIAALATTDSLNKALGKLEYKADVAYDLVKGAYDGDGTIENLAEILKVLDGIKDTDTIQAIIGKYLPLTGGKLNSGTDTPLVILGTDHSWIGFKNSSGTNLGWIGVLNSYLPSFYSDKSYKIWHEGNLTKVSQLTNDSGFLTSAALGNYVTLNTALTITGSKTFTASTNIFSGTSAGILTVDRNSTNPAWIKFCKNGTLQGYIGITNDFLPVFLSGESGASNKILIHSGNYTSYLPFLNSTSTRATNTSVIYAPTSGGTSGQILKSNGSSAPTWVNLDTIAAGSAVYLSVTSLNTEEDIVQSGVRAYSGSGANWTGEVKSMQYAAILTFGYPNRGFLMWSRRGDTSLRYRNGLEDYSGWNTERIILDSANYSSYLGYIGTTAVQASSAALALTGITNLTMNGTYTNNNKLYINSSGCIYPYSTSTRTAGMYGKYDSTKVGHVWSMGTDYKITDDGSSTNNMYGLVYFHTNWSNDKTRNTATRDGSLITEVSTYAGGHQIAFVVNGKVTASLGDRIWARAGFLKSGSSDSYVLLGGGGHKKLSDFLLKSEELTNNLTTITKTLVVSKDWVDTGIVFNAATFPNGTGSYIVQLSREDVYYWTGCLSIVISSNVTAADSDEILLHGGGYSSDFQYYLRTVHDTTNKVVKLQIARNSTYSTSRTYTFKFKKLI